MGNVFFQGARINEDVINIDNAEDVQELTQAIVGVGLKGGGSVRETERHDEIFEMSIPCTKRRLVFIALRNSKLIVRVGEIKAGVVLGILEAIEEF
jgi:hypothetical protein